MNSSENKSTEQVSRLKQAQLQLRKQINMIGNTADALLTRVRGPEPTQGPCAVAAPPSPMNRGLAAEFDELASDAERCFKLLLQLSEMV